MNADLSLSQLLLTLLYPKSWVLSVNETVLFQQIPGVTSCIGNSDTDDPRFSFLLCNIEPDVIR